MAENDFELALVAELVNEVGVEKGDVDAPVAEFEAVGVASDDEAADIEAPAHVVVDEVGWHGTELGETAEAEDVGGLGLADESATEFESVATPQFVLAVAG